MSCCSKQLFAFTFDYCAFKLRINKLAVINEKLFY